MTKQLNEECYRIVKEKVENGAKFVTVENEEIFNEFLDWSLCLSMIRRSQKVFTKVLEFHKAFAELLDSIFLEKNQNREKKKIVAERVLDKMNFTKQLSLAVCS